MRVSLTGLGHDASLVLRLAAEVWAARRFMQHDSQEIIDRAEQEEMPSLGGRVRYRLDQAYVPRLPCGPSS